MKIVEKYPFMITVILLVVAILFPRQLTATTLDEVLNQPGLWDATTNTIEEKTGNLRFYWTSERYESARLAEPGHLFWGIPVVEVLLWFNEGVLREIDLSFYNRGDVEPMSEADFSNLVKNATQTVTRRMGFNPMARDGGGGVNTLPRKMLTWIGSNTLYNLEWAVSKGRSKKPFQAEFLRLRMLPYRSKDEIGGRDQKVSAFILMKKTVTCTAGGDAYLADIPMIDQGPKGYCAVAAVERVLRYYGSAVDQHQLAQLTTTQGGTDPISLTKALQRIAQVLRLKITVLQEFTLNGFINLIENYNAVAKQRNVGQLPLPETGRIDMLAFYLRMNPVILVESRIKNPVGVKRFKEHVEESIGRRIPLLWGVMVGIVPEKNLPQGQGGHMRLIIGYNNKTQEIIYTDSWGPGHEFKRMPLDQAYAITTCLMSIQPR